MDSFFVEFFRLSQYRSLRVDSDDLYLRVQLLDLPGDASQSAPCASADDDVVDPALALVVDLLGGLVVVRQGVGWVLVLVEDVRVGKVLLEIYGDT